MQIWYFEVMPFGLMDAPAKFQKMMNEVLKDTLFAHVSLDQIFILSKELPDHTELIPTILERMKCWNPLKNQQGRFSYGNAQLLGHTVLKERIRLKFYNIWAIADVPFSQGKTGLHSFLGLASYCRRFIENFAKIAAPMHPATTLQADKIRNNRMNGPFVELKRRLCKQPSLAHPIFDEQFIEETVASSFAVEAVLSLRNENGKTWPS